VVHDIGTVFGKHAGWITLPPMRSALAACSSFGSTSMQVKASNMATSTHSGCTSSTPSATCVAADFRCRQPRVGTAVTS